MDENTSNSDSNEEFDQKELEVALYSQIHFDSSTDNQAWSRKETSSSQTVSQPFHIRVKELATRITPGSRKQPKLEGDFISLSAFTDSTTDSCVEEISVHSVDNSDNICKLNEIIKSEKNELSFVSTDWNQNKSVEGNAGDDIDIKPDIRCKTEDKNELLLNGKIKSESNWPLCSTSGKIKDDGQETETVGVGHTKEKESISAAAGSAQSSFVVIDTSNNDVWEITKDNECDGLQKKVQKKQTTEPKKKKTSGKEKKKKCEPLLPFTVTNVKPKPKAAQKVSVKEERDDDVDKIDTSTERSQIYKKKQPNLVDFLELSKPERDSSVSKKKNKRSLTKNSAAVIPRKPSVQLRRPPAVPVRYQQDSDTNTDYSESEVSSANSSPVKRGGEDGKLSTTGPVSTQLAADIEDNSTDSDIIEISKDRPSKEDRFEDENKAVEDCISDDEISSNGDKDSIESEENISDDIMEVLEDKNESNVSDSNHEDDDTASSDIGNFSSDPELEFNLEGGVDALLHKTKETDDGRWQIGERDRYNMNSILSRYFSPKTIQCRNCKKDGHLSRDCPEPLKRRCIFCGVEGHAYQSCPDAICFNCDAPGHKTKECRQPKRDWNTECNRCWMPGHEENMCPDRWRQFHITVDSKKFKPGSKKTQNPLVFCYNCGRKGHLGYECRAQRMNRFVVANYPLIARYDTKRRIRNGEDNPDYERGKRSRSRSFKGMDREETEICSKKHDRKRFRSHSRDAQHEENHVSMKHHRHGRGSRERETKKQRKEKRGRQVEDKFERSRSKDGVTVRFQSLEGSIPGPRGKGQGWGRGNASLVFRNQKMSKRDDFEDGECPDSDENLMDDYTQHQVKDNKWWNKQPDKKRRRKNQRQFHDGYEEDSPQFENMQRDNLDSYSTSSRTFFSTPNLGSNWSRGGNQRWEGDQWQGGRGDHFLQVGRDSRKRRAPENREESQSMSRFPDHRREDFISFNSKQEQRGSGQRDFPRGKNPAKGGLKHSTSWPEMNRRNHKGFSNRGGFQANNKRFLSMKNNCDITISLRK